MLEANNIVHRFGGVVATNNVSFDIQEHEIVSLIGPNGAGKTTLFNIIAGKFIPSAGSIRYYGEEIIGKSSPSIAEKGIIRTFQITSLFPGISLIDNLIIGRHRMFKSNLMQVLFNLNSVKREEKENLNCCIDILKFLGLEKEKDKFAKNLPYGGQRLMEIGIALAASPRLLMLDEPAAGLNETETNYLTALIGKIRDRGITVFLVEHDMSLVMSISDRIIVLANGEKIAEGLPQDVRNNPDVIAAYLGSPDFGMSSPSDKKG